MATSEGSMRTRQLNLAFLIVSEFDEVCSRVLMHQPEPNAYFIAQPEGTSSSAHTPTLQECGLVRTQRVIQIAIRATFACVFQPAPRAPSASRGWKQGDKTVSVLDV